MFIQFSRNNLGNKNDRILSDIDIGGVQQRPRKTHTLGISRTRRQRERKSSAILPVALRIIPQRLEAAQRAVRTCSLERDSGEKCERPRARRNAVREQTDELGERNGMRMLEVIIILRHAQIFRKRATNICGQQGRYARYCSTMLKARPPPSNLHS